MRIYSSSWRRSLIGLVILLFLTILVSQSQWFWKIFYPLHYFEEIERASKEYSLDPYLLYAIIYVESRFDSQGESRSGARGLMQIMPRTGAWIAESKGILDYQDEDLFDPAINISFGSFYLSHLLHRFDGELLLALAAYNAGTGNVIDWVKGEIWDGSWEDRDSIPFWETKAYLEKVFFVYQHYERIYASKGEGLLRSFFP